MMLDTDGGVYVAGITYASMGNTDYLVWKLTVGGVPQWYATYDHAGLADAATSLHMTGDGTLMVSGGSANASGTWDYARVYLHPATGDRLNVERVHVPDLIMTQALGHTRNMAGDIFLAGYGEAGGRRIAQLVKIGEDFNMAWSAAYDTEENSTEACSVDGDAYGNAYVCGTLRKQDGSSYIVILKYDPDGSLLWDRFSGAPAPGIAAWGTKAVATNDGGVAVLGTVHDGTSNNYRILKYLQDGQLEWTRDYDKLNGDELAMDMLVDGTSIYASGKSNTPNGNGYTTVKYTSTKLDNGYVYNAESGEPICVEGQVMVAFHPYDVDSSRVDDKDWQFGKLGDVVRPAVAEAIGQQLGLPPGEGKAIMAYKVYRRLTTADSISISRLGEEVRVPPFWATFLLGVELGEDPAEVIHGLNQLGDALHYAQPNFVYRLLGDPLYPARQQSLTPVAPYANAGINIEPAWAITRGRPEVRVGVVDELVRPDHPDFNIGSTSGSRVVGGHDYEADRSFESYVWEEEQPVFRPHGAACAGIIGAIRNNGEGLAGIAGGDAALGEPGCSLVTLGVARDDEFIPAAQIAQAILEGSSSFPGSPEGGFGCHVLNNSYGAGGFMNDMRDIELLRSIWQANRNQCVFVVARGNGQPEPIFPASYGPDGAVLSVGASGWDGSLMTVSNGGYNVSAGGGMDLIAPGAQETIVSLRNVDGPGFPFSYGCGPYPDPLLYTCFRASSAAAAHASGVAALMIGEHSLWNGRPNNLSPEDVERVMEKSATDIVGTPQWNPHYALGYDGWNGWGRLNAGEAVRQVAAPYRVYHSGEPDGTTVAAMPSETYVFNEYETSETWGLPPGPYEIQRYIVEHYYTVDFGPGTTILHSQQNPGFWGRPSSTVGLQYPQGQMEAVWEYQISGSTIEVTAYTYCYKVGSLPGQPPLTRWIPEPPNNLKTPWSLHILESPTVAVPENMQQATLRAHPNPATDQLHLSWTDFAPTHIEVIDQLGKVCLNEPAAPARNGNHTIGTAHLAPGLYTVRLSAAGERRTQRFIKH